MSMWSFEHAKVPESEGEYLEQGSPDKIEAMFGQPPRRKLGPRYTLWSSLVSILLATCLVWAVIYWSGSVLD